MKKITYVLFLVLLFSYSCKEQEIAEKPYINPPFPALNPEYETYAFDAEEGDTLKYKTGSIITIPPDIWVDTAGNKITGQVQVQYREFHNAEDIFLAGVPMAYDSAGVRETLKTAGMFEIRAYKDTNEIFVKEGEKINVKMASFDEKQGYNFYSLDEKGKNWAYKGTAEPQPNENIALMQDSINDMKPKITIPLDKNHFALDYWAILDVYFNVKPSGDVWKYRNNTSLKTKSKKYGLNWSGIYGTWNTLYFKGRKVFAYEIVWKNISGKRFPKWVQNKKYITQNRLIKLTNLGKNQYYMTVRDGYGENEKKFSFKAQAVMKLKELFKQMPDDWQAEYDKTMKKIAEAEARIKAQAAVFRSFDIDQTGLHNWDRIMKRDDRFVIAADFNFENKELDKAGIPLVYFIENDKSYVQVPFQDWEQFKLVPDSTAKFVAVLSETEMAVFSNKEYQKLDFSSIKSLKKHTFDLKTVKINSKEDFTAAIN